MCGITGIIDFTTNLNNEPQALLNMTRALAPRGPDAEDSWTTTHAALGHRRLIVIDPEGGEQPMVRRLGLNKYVIVYNGELYNMPEVKRELEVAGCKLESRSDTELILAAYMEWGPTSVTKLNGIFAFAIWDDAKQELFLARDRIGVKPLFYSNISGTFLFGSEIKALLAHPKATPCISSSGLAEMLLLGPARTPGSGIFNEVTEVLPGCWLKVSQGGIDQGRYWTLESKPHEDSLEAPKQKVRELLQDAITRQLISDVPLGTMLSGGLDSSIIAAIASDHFLKTGRGTLPTFAIDYLDNDLHFTQNEFQPNADTPWSKLMAESINSDHKTIYLDTNHLNDFLLNALEARDLPGMVDIDVSLLLFCQQIRKHCTVVLSGECADEVFGGYPWFHRPEMLSATTFPWARLVAERLPFINKAVFDQESSLAYVAKRYQEAIQEVPTLAGETPAEKRLREIAYLSLTRWMPTLLDRKDRMSMACGLEVRVPFCDHHLVEYVWNIPWSMKNYGQREKGLLRKAFKDLLPDEICNRKKSPYPKTHNPLYLNYVKSQIEELCQQETPLWSILNREQVSNFLQQELTKVHLPWFGQLLNVPALLAYFMQLNAWLKKYNVTI